MTYASEGFCAECSGEVQWSAVIGRWVHSDYRIPGAPHRADPDPETVVTYTVGEG